MTTAAAAPLTLDVSQTPRTPMGRLVGVEFRKAIDTRAGFWFVVSILGLVLVVLTIFALAAPESERTFTQFLSIAGGALGYFMPVLIILMVTSESSQRTGLVTFSLEPLRSRVVVAKFVAGLALAVLLFAASFLLGVFGNVLGGQGEWSLEAQQTISGFLVGNVILILVGFAIGMLLMNTPAAIVVYFAYTLILPTAVGILSAFSDWFSDLAPWIEFNTAQIPLFTGDFSPTGEEWAQIAVSGFIWLVIPLAVGIWRLLRVEFK